MSVLNELLESWSSKGGPAPVESSFGDSIDWNSPIAEVQLYVELPFWLMMPPGVLKISHLGATFLVSILGKWREVFGDRFLDSRETCIHYGPDTGKRYEAETGSELASVIATKNIPLLERPCKTMIRIDGWAHADAFAPQPSDPPPRFTREREAYRASLCEAHLPILNEVIQRYRLATYDYFAYEVSAWDIPVWYLKFKGGGFRSVLLLYKRWDYKPVTVQESADGSPIATPFEFTSVEQLVGTSSGDASPGEFDLLDARSLMERGNYTDAIRRTTTALEALFEDKLRAELLKLYPVSEVDNRLKASQNDVPGRIRQWLELSGRKINPGLLDDYDKTRQMRHQIVHKGRRLILMDRGAAQRMIDTSRWLYNHVEEKPERAKLRDKSVLKSIGRVGFDRPNMPTFVRDGKLVVQPLGTSS